MSPPGGGFPEKVQGRSPASTRHVPPGQVAPRKSWSSASPGRDDAPVSGQRRAMSSAAGAARRVLMPHRRARRTWQRLHAVLSRRSDLLGPHWIADRLIVPTLPVSLDQDHQPSRAVRMDGYALSGSGLQICCGTEMTSLRDPWKCGCGLPLHRVGRAGAERVREGLQWSAAGRVSARGGVHVVAAGTCGAGGGTATDAAAPGVAGRAPARVQVTAHRMRERPSARPPDGSHDRGRNVGTALDRPGRTRHARRGGDREFHF